MSNHHIRRIAHRPAPWVRSMTAAAGLALAFVTTGDALAQPDLPKPAAKAATEATGMPLPDGAIARLGSARFRFDGQPSGPVAFSSDSKLMAIGGMRSVSVFEVATGHQRYRFPTPDGHYPKVIRFLTGDNRLAVGSQDYQKAGQLTTHDLATGKVVATSKFTGTNQIHIGDVSADGARVLVVDWFAKVYLWDVKAAREAWSLEHKEAMFPRSFTADGKRFVLSGSRKVELHDAETGKLVSMFPDPGPRFRDRYYVGMSADGRVALGAEKGDAVAVLAAEGENRARILPSELRAERFFFSPDSRYLVAPSTVGTQVWDLSAADDKGPVTRLAGASGGGFSPDGKMLALADEGSITLSSVGEWKRLPQSADPPSPVLRARFLPDGKRVIGYTRQGWVTWPSAGGTATRLSDDSTIHPEVFADVSANGQLGVDVVFEPAKDQSSYMFAGKCTLRLTDLATGKDRRIQVAESLSTPIQASPDGRHVSAETGAGEFVTWDARTGDVLRRSKRKGSDVFFGAAPTADGKGLAWSVSGMFLDGGRGFDTGPMYSSVTATDHTTGRQWKLDPMPWSIYSGGARFSRDGSKMVLHGHFNSDWKRDSVAVWDMRTGRRLVNWEGESGRLESVSLSADNRSLLAGTSKGQLALVEVATGGKRAGFEHRGQVLSSAFHPDGTKAISSSPDGPVYVWDLLGSAGKWDAAKADAVWADLVSTDAKVAFASVRLLRANPGAAITFLHERVKLPTSPNEEHVSNLLKRLDSTRFADRELAQKELTTVAELIRPRLEAARKTASEEAGRRLDQVLKSLETVSPEHIRQIRACEAVEGIGTSDAVKLLRTWADGPPGARLTIEAKESLSRK